MGKQKNRLPEKQSVLIKDFKSKNDKQAEFIKMIRKNEVVIAKGVAGSGKTYCALATAIQLLGDVYKKVIIVKSVTSLPGEEIGFIPGSIDQKMEPTIMSFTWNLNKICGDNAAKALIEKGIVQVLPLAFIRGISIDNAVVIIDETQNMTSHTFKTMMTRIGENSKYIFLGDTEQVDLKKKSDSCLDTVLRIFADYDKIGTIEFTNEDCVRNPIIPEILDLLKSEGI